MAGACPGEELLAAFIDHALAPEERCAIERHAALCRDCAAAIGDTVRALASEPAAGIGPSPMALVRARASGPSPVRRSVRHAQRGPRRPFRFAAAALVLVAAAGAASLVGGVPAGSGAPDEAALASLPEGDLVVADVSGRLEARAPSEAAWHPVAAGERMGDDTALRSIGHEPATVVFEGNLSLSFRRDAEARLHRERASIDLAVAAGGVAVSPPEALAVRIAVPQGNVSSAGAPLEVLVRRDKTLVIARPGGAVLARTALGAVEVAPDHHTILFGDRPPLPPRLFPFRGRHGPHGRHGRHGPCPPPGGPELDRLFRDGPT